ITVKHCSIHLLAVDLYHQFLHLADDRGEVVPESFQKRCPSSYLFYRSVDPVASLCFLHPDIQPCCDKYLPVYLGKSLLAVKSWKVRGVLLSCPSLTRALIILS